ncbi:MAG TPA: HEAT repeat domain-containing protein [Steroidobacteraceae bacterium]|nr:HEAT repeat domain-containing protein [Steroidobacteraceae bacterium]
MNSQYLAQLLDDDAFDALDAGSRTAALARLAALMDCRNEWEPHARLVSHPVPAMPADLVADCRALVASGPQSRRGQRPHSRLILIGVVAVAAAAAALLVAYLWPVESVPQQETLAAAPSTPANDGPVPTSRGAPVAQPGAEAGEAPLPAFLVFVAPIREPEEIIALSKGEPLGWIGEQVAEIERNPVRRTAFTSFRTALIGELQRVPGIQLVESESQLGAAIASVPGFAVRIAGSYGMSEDGKLFDVGARYIQITVSVVRPDPDGTMPKQAPGLPVMVALDLEGGACRINASAATCGNVHELASHAVKRLRETAFPPDAEITRERQARLMNAALEPDERFKALEELLGPQGQHGRAAMRDPASVRGLLGLAASADPALRARLWRAIRGIAEPDLLSPLQSAALNDAEEARLEAVVTLAADFAQDASARATLETVANSDKRALVRALAQRGLAGEGVWRAYVNASLRDANRRADERIEAALYEYESVGRQPIKDSFAPRPYFEVLDQGAIDVLARLIPGAAKEMPASELRLLSMASMLASRERDSDAAIDALLHFLQHGSSSSTRRGAVADLGRWYKEHERVRAALRETLRNDPDPAVRERVTQVMGAAFASAGP